MSDGGVGFAPQSDVNPQSAYTSYKHADTKADTLAHELIAQGWVRPASELTEYLLSKWLERRMV